jgi:(R,R)-butanediol dehydrogenase/meso-butanediol dehydrogenase/diacetyl reductase
MRAIMFHGKEDLRVEQIAEPGSPQPGWVKLKVAWGGICGSDLHLYTDGQLGSTPTKDTPNPHTGEYLPIVLGHEFSGTVVELGEGVDSVAVGTNVAVRDNVACGECAACRSGKSNICRNQWGFGLSGGGGGLSEYINVPVGNVHDVKDMPLDHAAMIEPLSVATHAVRLSGAKEGDVAVVGGAGPVGLFVAAVLKAKGVKVIVSEPAQVRREKALSASHADFGINPIAEDLDALVAEQTDGLGADLVFDCAGAGPVVHQLIKNVRPGGHIQLIALPSKPLELNTTAELHYTEATVSGTMAYLPEDFEDSIAMINSGKLDVEPFVTARIEPDEIVAKGFETLIHHPETAIKILVKSSVD